MSYLFEPVGNVFTTTACDFPNDGWRNYVTHRAKDAVRAEDPSNRFNPANRVKTSTSPLDNVDKTFELWISDDEEDEEPVNDSSNEENHNSRIVNDSSHEVVVKTQKKSTISTNSPDPIGELVCSGVDPALFYVTNDVDCYSRCFSHLQPKTVYPNRRRLTGMMTSYYLVLTTLLHVCMLREDWKNALFIFSIIVSTQKCNIRQIWMIGWKILQHMNEEEVRDMMKARGVRCNKKQQVMLLSLSRNADLTHLFHGRSKFLHQILEIVKAPTSERIFRSRGSRFLSFMVRTFKVSILQGQPMMYPFQTYAELNSGKLYRYRQFSYLAYRAGSMRAVPLYTYSLLWQLLLAGEFREFDSMITHMQMKKPYAGDCNMQYLEVVGEILEVCTHLYEVYDDEKKRKALGRINGIRQKIKSLKKDPHFVADWGRIEDGVNRIELAIKNGGWIRLNNTIESNEAKKSESNSDSDSGSTTSNNEEDEPEDLAALFERQHDNTEEPPESSYYTDAREDTESSFDSLSD